jgi:D-alanyl-D-alanine carboxypeptidase/D-alanyl-D-alanine-endopeptidase (penicillin-binding protein 4)
MMDRPVEADRMRVVRTAIGAAAAAAVLVAAAACSPSASVRDPGTPSGPSVAATASTPPDPVTPSAGPTIVVNPVETAWTRAIEGAVGGRDVSVAVGADDRIRFVHAGAIRRIPASNQKLLTSMAALDSFGPDHRFTTIAAVRHPAKGGTIRGDLWVVGSGDPEIDAGSMARLAAAVRTADISRITGSVIGDTSAFTREWWAPGWVPGLSRSYVTRTTALAFDANAGSGLPEEAAAASLTTALRAEGVEVIGAAGAGEAPARLEPVARIASRPLRELLSVQNHGSVNFYAETLLKALGAQDTGGVGSTTAGAGAVEAWAARHGVTAHVRDGSGLSHQDLVSAQGLVTLLLLAQDEPWGRTLDTSLAPPGDGTLEGRLLGIPVRAKTGTLFETPVSSLSGYVTDAGGARIAFSVISRGLDKSTAIAIEDAIVRALAGSRVG